MLCKFGLEKVYDQVNWGSLPIYLGDVVLGRNEELG